MASPAAAPPAPSPPPQATLLDYTLRTAPVNVVLGTFSCTALGAITGSALGIIRNYPAIPAAFKTGVNTGVFSFTFFSTREYLLHPLLTTLRLQPSPLEPNAPHPHSHNLLSSALAGTISGAIFSSFMRGGPPATSLRAGVTLGLGCTVAQGFVNELEVGRIKLLAWGEERDRRLAEIDEVEGRLSSSSEEQKEAPPSYTRDISSPRPSVPSRETFSERSDRLIGEAWGWGWSKVARLAPLKKMEEGEYVGKLETRLGEVEAERDGVRRELGELENKRGSA